MAEKVKGGNLILVADPTARKAAAAAQAKAEANAKLIADLRAELANGDHNIRDDKVRQIIADYVAEHKFGDNQGRAAIASFVPNDLSTIPAFFRFNQNSERRMDGTKSGYAIAMRDSSGNSVAPLRYVAWTDGPTPDLWFGFIMGGNPPQISWYQLLGEGSIDKSMLSQALQAEINARQRESQQAPPRLIVLLFARSHRNTAARTTGRERICRNCRRERVFYD